MLDSFITPQSVSPQPPSATSPLGQFIAQLSRLVLEEAETARRQVQQVWMRPVAARVAAGRAISGITIKRGEAPDLLVLSCSQNESRFREGDILCLNSGNPFDAPNLLVTLEADEDTELLVSSEDAGLPFADLLERPDGWVLDEGFLDFSATTLEALNQAADTAAGRERILPLLTGQRRPQLDMQRYEQARAAAERLKLNEQQIDAVASAYASDLGYVIQGPPGTGKTLVLACIAQLMAEEGQRVLITGFTHRAINNALNTFAKQSQCNDLAPVTAIKIGRRSRADNLLVENYESQFPQYDIVLIDEAQFFAPIWFEIIKHILVPQRSHLFMVADPTQGFLKRKQSWLASGLEVRGRSHRLEKMLSHHA